MLEEILEQIPKEELIKGRWYLGRGRNNNLGYWNGNSFLTIGFKFNAPVIKFEDYYEEKSGCFQPFKIIDEGKILEQFEENGWGKHYGKKLILGLD